MQGRGRPNLPGAGPDPGRRTVEWIDPAALMKIDSLELRARVLVDGLLTGRHRGPRHGQSVEFSEYRAYTPGDDPRSLDWKLFARTDRSYVRRFEEETSLGCTIVLDDSRSMLYGSGDWTKADYARTLAATLTHFLLQQRDAVGLVLFDDAPTEVIPTQHRGGQLYRVLVALEGSGLRGARSAAAGPNQSQQPPSPGLPATLESIAAATRRRGIVLVLSDLLSELDGLEQSLGVLQTRGQDVILLQILDPAELTLDVDGPAILEDLETGRRLAVDPAMARRSYRERIDAHLVELDTLCQRQAVDLVRVQTSESPGDALAAVLHRRRCTLAGRRRSAA